MKSPKRKPAKKPSAAELSAAARTLMVDLRLPESFLARCRAAASAPMTETLETTDHQPITRAFLVRLAAVQAALIAEIIDDKPMRRRLDRFAAVIGDAVRRA